MTRARVVLLGLVGALCILASGSMAWLDAHAVDTTGQGLRTMTGARVHPSLAGVGSVAAAAAVALSLVDGLARRIVAVILAIAGASALGLAASTALTRGAPAGAAGSLLVDGLNLWGPAVAGLGGVTAATAGMTALLRGGGWAARPARQGRDRQATAPAGDWDRLSAGEDPTA